MPGLDRIRQINRLANGIQTALGQQAKRAIQEKETIMKSTDRPPAERRAGQRPDELLPDEYNGAEQKGDQATGSPGGGVGASGIGGLPADDGAPGDAERLD